MQTTGKSRGFAFVGFDTTESANNAIEGMNGKEFEGKHLKVHDA